MKITYLPSKDELLLKINETKRKPNKSLDHLKLWWDDNYNISAIAITNYSEVIEDFRRILNVIQLGGFWKGIKFTEEDIRSASKELLNNLEGKF